MTYVYTTWFIRREQQTKKKPILQVCMVFIFELILN